MTKQSIIVYDNSIEEIFIESKIISPLGGMSAGYVTFFILMWIAQKVLRNRRDPNKFVTGAAAVVSICIGAATSYWLFIQ